MSYLVDTDLVIDHLANIPQAKEFLETLAPEGIAISIITYMETYQGVIRSENRKEALVKFQTFRKSIPVLPFSLSVAERCAAIREQLKKAQKPVRARALDLINAAIAIEYDLTLVTRNSTDYKDIPDLNLFKFPAE